MANLRSAVAHYETLDAAELRQWLNEEYPPHKKIYDGAKAFIETEFPGVTLESGLRNVRITEGPITIETPIHDWHDLLLTQVLNGATSDDSHLHGYDVQDGDFVATVETLCGLLAPRPVSPVVNRLRTVWSAFLSAFLTKPKKV